jgi:hypothetical protein
VRAAAAICASSWVETPTIAPGRRSRARPPPQVVLPDVDAVGADSRAMSGDR